MDADATLDATGAVGGALDPDDSDAAPSGDSSSTRQRVVGGHKITGRLGRGGMGTVFRAIAPDGEMVALKQLDGELLPEDEERFLREARLRFEHPNIVQTLRAGIDVDGAGFLVMELLEGRTFAEELREGAVPAARAVTVALAVCAALECVHARLLIHRDVKPSNVFCCEDGTVKLLDFGVAAHRDASIKLTRTGAIVGTPGHLAPEQAHGEVEVDARADVWAVGVLLFEAVAGRLPFVRDGAFSTMLAIATKRAPRLDELVPGAPTALVDIVERCLEPDPKGRWPDMMSLRAALEGARDSVRPPPPSVSRGARVGLGVALALLVSGASAAWAFWPSEPEALPAAELDSQPAPAASLASVESSSGESAAEELPEEDEAALVEAAPVESAPESDRRVRPAGSVRRQGRASRRERLVPSGASAGRAEPPPHRTATAPSAWVEPSAEPAEPVERDPRQPVRSFAVEP